MIGAVRVACHHAIGRRGDVEMQSTAHDQAEHARCAYWLNKDHCVQLDTSCAMHITITSLDIGTTAVLTGQKSKGESNCIYYSSCVRQYEYNTLSWAFTSTQRPKTDHQGHDAIRRPLKSHLVSPSLVSSSLISRQSSYSTYPEDGSGYPMVATKCSDLSTSHVRSCELTFRI